MSDEFEKKIDRLLELDRKFHDENEGLGDTELDIYMRLREMSSVELARRYRAQQAEIVELSKLITNISNLLLESISISKNIVSYVAQINIISDPDDVDDTETKP
jgi:hypothetical protein